MSEKSAQQSKHPRQTWFLTYGANGPDITHQMLSDEGPFIPEECYTVNGREFKYTLIHLNRGHRVRESAFHKFMKVVGEKFGIVQNNVFGYDKVACNLKDGDRIEDHPGFMLMKEKMNSGDDGFRWWMLNGDIATNKCGLLWKYRLDIDPDEMPRTLLVQKAAEGKDLLIENTRLKRENDELAASFQALQEENQKLEGRVKRQYDIICEYEEFVKEGKAAPPKRKTE